jgi:microcin C transport system substrate-binding protein
VFGAPFMPPVSDGSGQDRMLLRKAVQLLTDAGCVIKDGKRMTPQGEPFRIEFLLDEPAFQAHHMPFIKNLGTLGIEASLRLVDPVQFRARRDDFDFDVVIERFGFSTVPGDSLRPYFSSQSAATKGSNNLAGISDPVIDSLVEQLIAADTRPKLVFVARALDRVIRAGRYWVPQWYANTHRLAYWDVFGHPANLPKYLGAGAPDLWWSAAKSPLANEAVK